MVSWAWFLSLVPAGIVILLFVLFYMIRPSLLMKYKIDERRPQKKFLVREVLYTAISLSLFYFIGYLMDSMLVGKYTLLYYEVQSFPAWYLGLSVLILFLMHDTYFYWTHRLFHGRFLFQHVHSWHHTFHHPNPFTAFAFHPFEAIVQIGFVPLVSVLLPLHQTVLLGFTLFIFLLTTYGHLGFELRANKKGLYKIFNTSIHHYLHHVKVHCNFGIYLNFWDWISGTNDVQYKATMEEFRKKLKKG